MKKISKQEGKLDAYYQGTWIFGNFNDGIP